VRVEGDRVVLDFRTIFSAEEEELVAVVRHILSVG
jgi:hypothetical protein